MRLPILSTLTLSSAIHSRRYLSMTSSKVAVIGGGLSGILAGRELMELGIKPIIFEASKPGGVWNSEQSRMWDSLKTNLSKYTCSISTQDWPESTPAFPPKAAVEEYITQLSKSLDITTNTKVTTVEYLGPRSYRLRWLDASSQAEQEDIFEQVVIACGFFTKSNSVSNIDVSEFHGRIIHSHEYREPSNFLDREAVVVGGSFSGCEIAAEIAKRAKIVHHVLPHHAYVVPTFIPEDVSNPSSAFLPLDVVLYRMNDRRLQSLKQALESEDENSPIEIAFKEETEDAGVHNHFLHVVGVNNDILRDSSSSAPKERKARVVISDQYRRMVKMGKIKVHHGKLRKVSDSVLTVASAEGNLTDIPAAADSCLLAVGFCPDTSIFCSEILDRVEYSPASNAEGGALSDDFMPFILHQELLHPALPGLFFVGMYKGPYFGVMEMQAKLVAQYVAGTKPLPDEKKTSRGLQLARRIREQDPRPLFPHPDYMGMAFDYARELGRVPDETFRAQHSIITPKYFTGDATSLEPMYREIRSYREEGKLIGRAILQALENDTWTFHRTITDKLTNSQNTVTGKVTFQPIAPDYERVLYKEQGILTLPNGQFEVSQHYIYQYDATKDSLEVFFSAVGKPETIDRPFVSLKFTPESEGWQASAYHLCSCDNYHAKYTFAFAGMAIPRFRVEFDVDGPAKNYRSVTEFSIVVNGN